MKKPTFLIIGLFLLFAFFHFRQSKEAIVVPAEIFIDNILQIQKIGLSVPIIYSDSESEGVIQKNLESGVVHLPNTASPGEIGNVYLVGHSSDYIFSPGKYKTVFAELDKLEVQDEIIITYQNNTFKYLVYDKKVVAPDDLSVLSQESSDKKLLTLQTSYPVNTAQKRLIILAEFFQKSDNR